MEPTYKLARDFYKNESASMRVLRKLEKIHHRNASLEAQQGANRVENQLPGHVSHLRHAVKQELRALNLFRAFLKGIPYAKVESSLRPGTVSAQAVINRTTTPLIMGIDYEKFNNWLEGLE